MTIAELVVLLQQLPPDWDVTIGTDDGEGCVDAHIIEQVPEVRRIILRD